MAKTDLLARNILTRVTDGDTPIEVAELYGISEIEVVATVKKLLSDNDFLTALEERQLMVYKLKAFLKKRLLNSIIFSPLLKLVSSGTLSIMSVNSPNSLSILLSSSRSPPRHLYIACLESPTTRAVLPLPSASFINGARFIH